jgi:RNA polymerase sigma-70 factor (ECF subfamily)
MTSPLAARLRLVPPPADSAPGELAPALDDSELLAAVRAGDPSAATAFHDRTRGVVSRTINRLLGRQDSDAEDVAQLAFIELINTIQHFRGDCPLDAWVSVLTARVVYKQIRRRRLERKLFSAVPAQAIVMPSSATKRDLAFRDALRSVQGHLSRIDASRCWTFLLHDVYGYDLKEVATITGASVAAAQSRLVRGRREIHERIGADSELSDVVADLCQEEDER